jgi:hypothetical protein
MIMPIMSIELGFLDRALSVAAVRELELEAKGFPPQLVRAAISRATGAARRKAEPLSPSIREQAYYEFLVDELKHVEDWITRLQNSVGSS